MTTKLFNRKKEAPLGVWGLFIALSLTATAQAQYKIPAVKSGTGYARMLETVSKPTTLPTSNHFLIVWESDSLPQTFFYRGDGGWLTCRTRKVHKAAGSSGINKAKKFTYTTERVSMGDIHKGDTIELAPITGGRFPIPQDIPPTAKNTIFFKAENTNWLALLVNGSMLKYPAKHTKSNGRVKLQ